MAELLSREKDFIKLNEELNKMSMNTSEMSNDKPFQSYTKATNISKHGDWAGDAARKQSQTPPIDVSDGSNASSNSKVLNVRNKFIKENDKSVDVNPQRKKLHEIKTGTTSPRYGDRKARNSKNDNLMLCFQNANFIDSPSLEMLVKEQTTSLQIELDIEAGISSVDEINKTTYVKKNLSRVDSLTKFLKAKITILEAGHERLLDELTKQKSNLEKTLELNKQISRQLEQTASKNNTISEELAKTEQKLEEAKRLDKERLHERGVILKELEAVKIKVQTLTRGNSCLEKRLYRVQEELQDTKSALKNTKVAERQIQNANQAEDDKKTNQIKSLKKQRSDILNAYKKQLVLIDNLRRQNTCLEHSKKVAISEKEFNKILDWNKNK